MEHQPQDSVLSDACPAPSLHIVQVFLDTPVWVYGLVL